MWPDGNADVGKFESRLGTSGRGRLTTAAIVRKAASSPNMTTARKTTGRQRRVTARNTTQLTTPTMRMSWVAPRLLPIWLQWFSADVRCAANQCGIVWSPRRLPFPLRVIMISLPMPVRAPTISTQHTTTPAAIRPYFRARSCCMVVSGSAGWRSVRRRLAAADMALLLPIVSRFTLFAGCLLAALVRSGVLSPPPYDRVARSYSPITIAPSLGPLRPSCSYAAVRWLTRGGPYLDQHLADQS